VKDSDPILDWRLNDNYPNAISLLGPVPALVTAASDDVAWQQFHDNHFWEPQDSTHGWKLMADDALLYPNLPPVMPVAFAWLRGEKIMIYPAGFVVIVQLNGDFSICRMF